MTPRPAEGSRLGPYELQHCIGKGGMGEVWQAHDTRLGRDVAIKFSEDRFSDRIEKEARAIAALNHPNICTVYDVGPNYLVMELIDGPTLTDRISEGPIPVDEAIAIARQIADALDAAHEKNIIHRDLKPGNIKLRTDGSVKVLDFGLAKAAWDMPLTDDSPTMLMNTQFGIILGTAAYMAPEQARGKQIDKRADIWAFGVVLHEMVTGKHLFEGEDLTETLANVVKSDPDFAPAPYKVQLLLTKCLQKDPKRRLRDIGDAWELLRESEAAETRDDIAEAHASRIWREARVSRIWPIVAGAMTIVALAISFVHFREKPVRPPEALRFQIHLPSGVRFQPGAALVISPDGRHVAFPALVSENVPHIFVQDIYGGQAKELANTRIGVTLPPVWWSPDSAWIAYSGAVTIDKVELASGQVQPICEKPAPAIGGAWNRDGTIIFGSPTAGLWRVPPGADKPVPLTRLDASHNEIAHELPIFLPDGRHYLFLALSSDKTRQGIFARSIDDGLEMPSRFIVQSEFSANFVPSPDGKTGWLLYLRNGSAAAQLLDVDRLSLDGKVVALPAAVATAYQTALFAASPDVLVYRAGGAKRVGRFEWIDTKTGKSLGTIGEPSVIGETRISPDEKRVAYSKEDDRGISDLWLLDLERGTTSRLTFGDANYDYPVWSPDGSELAYARLVDGWWQIFRRRMDGNGGDELLLKEPGKAVHPSAWSPDGRSLLYAWSDTSAFTPEHLAVLPLQKGAASIPLSPGSALPEAWGKFSADGRYVLYGSFETGRYEIYVRGFDLSTGQPGGKWMVSNDGGRSPVWTGDGKKMLWVNKGAVWSASVDMSRDMNHGFRAGVPELFYRIPLATGDASLLLRDGRALVVNPETQIVDEPMNVIVNWMSTLKTPESPK